ncbi:hypothetical protein LN996_04680 [Arthrobacter sp. AK01]|uniref:hypothetical protein n=1 Tax=Arthrobacter sp. AK01 TaxID=2894084 RepID=UPI001E539C20|nr:hypothetical protein [Arthrobacter sp. AK01]MCD4850096.1 hypothetical protein [Arthrobacter sp. AK01]
MLMSLVVSEVAVASPPTDYTPAIIGLGGVVLGGMIQTFAQIAKERAARVAQTRTDVLKFAHAAYSFVDVTNQYAGLYHSMPRDNQKIALARINELMHAAHESGMLLAGASDVRVGTFAVDVINQMMEYKDGFAHVFQWHGEAPEPDPATTFPTRADVRENITVIINMVHPRAYERHLRFRSAETARKSLAEEAKQKERRHASDGTPVP